MMRLLRSGVRVRSFVIYTPALYEGDECAYSDGQQDTMSCNAEPCPVGGERKPVLTRAYG